MSSDRHFSTRRLLGTSGLFIGILMLILLMGSHAPFGLSFADDAVNTHQLVRTEVVKFQDSYEMQRDFLGLVEVPQSSRLGFEITGKIDQLHYDEGDQVEAGEVMASLDTARLNAQYQEALAALKSARANATLAASTYQRFLNASRQSAVSEQEIDEAKETFDAATSQVDVSKARLKTIVLVT